MSYARLTYGLKDFTGWFSRKVGLAHTLHLFLCFYIILLVLFNIPQYDEAREYVERARKCLATELAALVSFFLMNFRVSMDT